MAYHAMDLHKLHNCWGIVTWLIITTSNLKCFELWTVLELCHLLLKVFIN